MSEAEERHSGDCHGGGCHCGGIRYEVEGDLRPALICHCGMCQTIHSGPAYYSAAENERLKLTKSQTLSWYRASPSAARGFCTGCGASLFWRPEDGGYTAISCGSLDRPSGVEAAAHVFLVDKGDYYQLTDDLPRFERGSGGKLPGVTTVLPE